MLDTTLEDHYQKVGDSKLLFYHMDVSYHETVTETLYDVLNKWSWTIPGLGFSSDYCMRTYITATDTTKTALKVSRLKCGRVQCPNCYEWWISERVFEIAVKILAYAKVHDLTPLALSVSEHPDKVKNYTWSDYTNSFRRMYARLKKRNVDGGYRVFHPFRIPDYIKRQLEYFDVKSAGGYWKLIRENCLDLESWYDYVYLAPHLHCIAFSEWVDECTDTDIVIKNYSTLDTTSDLVGHLRYLLTHAGILTDDEKSKPTMPFGCMHKFNMNFELSPEEIIQIKTDVAEAMGLRYDSHKDKIEVIPEDDQEDNFDWIPLFRFKIFSALSDENTQAFLAFKRWTPVGAYINDVIERYLYLQDQDDLPLTERHVFLEDLPDPPEGLTIFYDHEVIQ